MKIRQRLALRFTLVSALLTGAILIIIFFVTRRFVHADFIERLTQQSRFDALHYGAPNVRDVIPPGSFLLVNPSTSIYDEAGTLLYSEGDYQIPESWVTYLRSSSVFNAERGQYTTVGRRYDINNQRYLVFVSDKDLPGQHELDILVKAIVVGWAISLVFSYLAGLYFSGDALRPVKRVVREVKQITKDNLSYRLKLDKEITRVDEIDELIITFNALLARIETAFIAQKRFVQHASHELKTPLTAIMAEAELALVRDRHKDDYKRTLEVIVGETERLVSITQGLLTLTRLEENAFDSEREVVDVQAVLNDTLVTFKRHHPDRELIMKGQLPSVHVLGNALLLQTALGNVLDNAVKYSNEKIVVHFAYAGDTIEIGVQDFGIGIPPAELNRVRSPLFRASNAGAIPGAGLGLSLVDRIIKIHDGLLAITSVPGEGTWCRLKLPVVRFEG